MGDLLDYAMPFPYMVKSEQYHPEYKTPVLTAGKTFVLGYTNETEGVYPASKANPVIIFDDFTGAIQWVDFPFKVRSRALKILTGKRTDVLMRYLWYLMLMKNFSSSTHTYLWISTYSQFVFQIPPIDIQHRIVNVLDNFDAICSDLQIGLPAEIDARQKQYEYYRDQLLGFAVTGKPVISVSESNRGG